MRAGAFLAVDLLASFLAAAFFAVGAERFVASVRPAEDVEPVVRAEDDFLAVLFFAVLFVAVLPEAVLLDAAVLAAEAVAFGSFFAPDTTSLKLWPALNFGTEVFLMRTVAPVLGLRPVRAGRATFSKTPKPVIATRSPEATARVTVSITASTASVALFLLPSWLDSLSIS